MTIHFIGAGPGDPELITVKGQRLLQRCPVVLYAGSLIPPGLLQLASDHAEVADTAPLSLAQIIERLADAHARGLDVARLHSGDPSLYGAVAEQIRRLDALGIPSEIIPGVTATAAASAVLKRELTLPGISQTVILTRIEGKTSMPPGEALADLARHRATLSIHLAIPRIHKVVEALLPHYGADCPVVVLVRVSWPDQDRIDGTLSDIVQKVRDKRVNRTALILVGHVLAPEDFDDSHLYRADQAHIYRPRRKKTRL
jgi:precorrin-4/cobalt-precorrin-4 C11-methyltransferase